MTVAQNKSLVRRAFDEAVNRGDLRVVDDGWAPDMFNHGGVSDREAIKRWVLDTRATFPDLHATVEAIVGEESYVATRESWRATHALTGRRVNGTILHMFRFADGLVAEEWSQGWEWLDGIEVVSANGRREGRVFDVHANIVPMAASPST